jgi:hypothetical protein
MDGGIDGALQALMPYNEAGDSSRGAGRARLAAASGELAAATAALEAAQQFASRLSTVIGEASRLEAELATLRMADEMRLGAWLAEGSGEPRPQPGAATQDAETRVAVMAADAAAARAALPAAEQTFHRRAEMVRTWQRQRDEAICGAAVEAAHKFAAGYHAALTAALECEARLRGLRDELAAWGNRAGAPPTALAAAAQIAELIAVTKRGATVALNQGAGCRLIAALAADADAEL